MRAAWVVLLLALGCFENESLPIGVGPAVSQAGDPVETFRLRQSSGGVLGLRAAVERAFPAVAKLVGGGAAARDKMIGAFDGQPVFDDDLKLAIFAYALEKMGDASVVDALKAFVAGNLDGDLWWSPHFAVHAIHTLSGKADAADKAWYRLSELRTASGALLLGAADDVTTRSSCVRQVLLVDSDGKAVTFQDGATQRNAVVAGQEFAASTVPDGVRDGYLAAVAAGGGTYATDDTQFAGVPTKQFNDAGYAFRELNGGRRWVVDPSEAYRALVGAGALVEVAAAEAKAGDKVFYFQPGATLPGHVAEVRSVASGVVTVRNADGQSGLWDARLDAAYFTMVWFDPAKYMTPKVFRWKDGKAPAVEADPALAADDATCEAGGGGTVGGNSLAAKPKVPGYGLAFDPTTIKGTNLASYDGGVTLTDVVAVYGAETATTGTPDTLELMFDRRQITASGTLLLKPSDQVFDAQAAKAALRFKTPDITNADDGLPVLFEATNGSVVLSAWGTEVGQRLTGTFDAAITGPHVTGTATDGTPIEETLSGTLTGTFDVVIEAYSL